MVDLESLMTNMYHFNYSQQQRCIEYKSTDGCHEGGTTLNHQEAVILRYNLEQLLDIVRRHIED